MVAHPKVSESSSNHCEDSLGGADDVARRCELFFETKVADQTHLIEQAQALRYQVYCLERRFEDPSQHIYGLETDEYDSAAVHGLLYYRPTNAAMGTVRMICPLPGAEVTLPITSILREQGIDLRDHVRIEETVEISRFAISKELRRRREDQDDIDGSIVPLNRHRRPRDGNLPCLSLIQFLVRESSLRGISYWTAVMEPKLLRMLAGMGIRFAPVGGLVMHHGLRQPGFCHVPTMLSEVRRIQPAYWDILTRAGEFSSRTHSRGQQLAS